MPEELTGEIERVTYANAESGFAVARVRVAGRREPITVAGPLAAPVPGQLLKMRGEWIQHPEYGRQYKVMQSETMAPITSQGVERYLASGIIPGIGPELARRIVARFGADALDVVDKEPERLRQVSGLGAKRLAGIRSVWEQGRVARGAMVFLESHGVSPGLAAKIFRHFGRETIGRVRHNPYHLASEIDGVGFRTADRIARELGIPLDSPFRAEAAVLHLLHQLSEEGHTAYPRLDLVERCGRDLEIPPEVASIGLAAAMARGEVLEEKMRWQGPGGEVQGPALFLKQYHRAERAVAARIVGLCDGPRPPALRDPERMLAGIQEKLVLRLAPAQAGAVLQALRAGLQVITGGPGTGKTTLIRAILVLAAQLGRKVLLAAPTGRAAKRMSEATGSEARTLHRLLEFSFQKGGFQRNETNPLSCDLLIVDEASMIDILLMDRLLRAVSPGTSLVLVGDANQLPSVGPGNVLGDLIASGAVPVVKLREIFRQARESRIVVNAHRILAGEMPWRDQPGERSDFLFREREDPAAAMDFICDLVCDHLPGKLGFDPLADIQVLTPMHRGQTGTGKLNAALQRRLNPGAVALEYAGRRFAAGDKVMQVRNNYGKEVFNGDIGKIVRAEPRAQKITVRFEEREVDYDPGELDQLVPAWAVSVHKAQGSEYPAVIVPVMTEHFIMLQRNLLYTAVTRGRKLVVLVGSRKALAIGVKNDQPLRRFTSLRQRLGA